MSWLHEKRVHILLLLCGLVVYGAVAGGRLGRQSSDPHFVYLADALMQGRLAIDPTPKKGDDWAILETVELDDGTVAQGRRMLTRKSFQLAGGGEIDVKRIKKRRGKTHYVSFPPAPALLMVPSALLSGRGGNDVIPTVLAAALILPLMFSALRRMAEAGLSQRTRCDDLWLVAAYAFGSVFFFCAVQGRVWFTAHVFGALMIWGYLYNSIDARRPIAAGVFLALAALSRAPLAFAFPIFAFEAWRSSGGDWRQFLRHCALFAAPVIVFIILAVAYNQARWGEPTEFGHSFLHVRQQYNMEIHGLFDTHYLARNLRVAFTLLPTLSGDAPFIQISGHGLALWLTTPLLMWVLWARRRTSLHVPLWLTTALIAVPLLLYQNTGWVQFGYRFGTDLLPFLFLLIALGGLSLGRAARALIVVGIAINLFGAITFDRHHQHYRTDAAAYRSVEHR